MRQSKKIHGPEVRLSSKLFFAKVKALSHDDCGCWIWDGGTTGGGVPIMSFAGQRMTVRRGIMTAQNKTLPQGKLASNTCGNIACVNPDHVVPISHEVKGKRSTKNVNKKLHSFKCFLGTIKKHAKLTQDQVNEIRASDESSTKIAPAYGVDPSMIRRIRAGTRWKHMGVWGMI